MTLMHNGIKLPRLQVCGFTGAPAHYFISMYIEIETQHSNACQLFTTREFDLFNNFIFIERQENLCNINCVCLCMQSAWCQECQYDFGHVKSFVHIVIIYSQILKCSISIKLTRVAKTLSFSLCHDGENSKKSRDRW